MNTQELQALFFKEIPLTQSMGLAVTLVSADKVEIEFKLAPNKNHKGTAFGGSQYTACALACYGLFLAGIREKGFTTNDIVIAEGRIKYKSPVKNNFRVRATWDISLKTRFFKTLTENKCAKVLMSAQILSEEKICADFSGDFVASLETTLK